MTRNNSQKYSASTQLKDLNKVKQTNKIQETLIVSPKISKTFEKMFHV